MGFWGGWFWEDDQDVCGETNGRCGFMHMICLLGEHLDKWKFSLQKGNFCPSSQPGKGREPQAGCFSIAFAHITLRPKWCGVIPLVGCVCYFYRFGFQLLSCLAQWPTCLSTILCHGVTGNVLCVVIPSEEAVGAYFLRGVGQVQSYLTPSDLRSCPSSS